MGRAIAVGVALTVFAMSLSNSASAGPDSNEFIVFARANDIFKIASVGGPALGLTAGPDLDQDPAWSPSHSTIAFSRQHKTGVTHLFAMNAQGGSIRQLGRGRCSQYSPTWAPSGTRIAFIQRCGRGYWVATLDLKTHDVHRIAPGYSASWSPNGRWIALSALDKQDRSSIYLVRPDGSSRHRLLPKSRGPVDTPDWSPNGQMIALTLINNLGATDASKYSSDLAEVKPSGKGFHRLTSHHDGYDSAAKWSPDGSRLTFVRAAEDNNGSLLYSRLMTLSVNGPAAGSPSAIAENAQQPDW